MTINELYQRAVSTPGDIWEHLPTLVRLANKCRHITEFGTRYGISTAAFLYARPSKFIAYDISRHEAVSVLEEAVRAENLDFQFIQADVLSVEIEDTDLLFIDTLHTRDQLIAELCRHGGRVNEYIVLHDTMTFGDVGEVGESGGLKQALREYLADHSEWSVIEEYQNNNGLTVLQRGKA